MIDYNNYANIILFIANIVNVTKTKINAINENIVKIVRFIIYNYFINNIFTY
jgi:hypothetical protein